MPRSRRQYDNDYDDDRPPRARRSDDDRPRAKGNPLPLVLGIVSGLLVLGCGSGIGVWLVLLKPALDKPASSTVSADELQQQTDREVFRANVRGVREQMTRRDVDRLLGSQHVLVRADQIPQLTAGMPDAAEVEARWTAKNQLGHVRWWDRHGESVLVAFSTFPTADARVVGVLARLDSTAAELVKLPPVAEMKP